MATGAVILNRAATLLQDDDHTRWTLPELVDWINEATRAICLAKPSASSRTMALTLVEGTLQSVPATGNPLPVSLLRLVRNLKQATPAVGGRIITPTDRQILDVQVPYWHDGSLVKFKQEVRQFVFSDDDPMSYYVYPGNDGNGIVEAVLATLPAALEATGPVDAIGSYGAEIGLSDIYSVPLVDFVCYRAQAKDDVTGNAGRAAAHYGQFATAMGIKIQSSAAMTPSRQNERV
jgi:hypothetical protein